MAVFFHGYVYGESLGGVERRFIEVSKRLSQKGIELFAIEFSPSLGQKMPVGYHSLKIVWRKPKTVTQEAQQILRLTLASLLSCRRLRCDLVYSPSGVYLQVIPAYITSLVLRKKLVIVFHSLPTAPYKTKVTSAFKSSISSGESLRKATFKAVIEYLRVRAYSRADACISVSKATADQIRSSFTPKRVAVTGNGVGDEWFSIEKEPATYDACFLGRISPRKGVELLILAWKELLREYPNAKLVIVGGGESEAYVRRCADLVRRLGLNENVSMTGFVDDVEVKKILRSSKVFVLPSSREGFGLAIVEAMASGVPCVLPELKSLRENFGKTAVFVRDFDPSSWASKISSLLGDDAYRERLSAEVRKEASRFTWYEVASKEAAIILDLAGKNRPSELVPVTEAQDFFRP